jgi:hypothetical protein
VSGNVKAPLLMKFALQSLKYFAPQIVHDCPYTGTVETEKIGFQRSMMLLFPGGEYRYDFVFKTEGKEVMRMEWEFEMI